MQSVHDYSLLHNTASGDSCVIEVVASSMVTTWRPNWPDDWGYQYSLYEYSVCIM